MSSAVSFACALALSLMGCGGSEGPAPELASDVSILRELLVRDPATGPLEDVERVADERPVLGARLLASGALPAARTQLARARAATLTTPRGRAWKRRLVSAYEQRLRGLEQWHGFLEDAASDDTELLAATTTLRQAQVAIVEVGRALEEAAPLERERGPAADDVEPASEPPSPRR